MLLSICKSSYCVCQFYRHRAQVFLAQAWSILPSLLRIGNAGLVLPQFPFMEIHSICENRIKFWSKSSFPNGVTSRCYPKALWLDLVSSKDLLLQFLPTCSGCSFTLQPSPLFLQQLLLVGRFLSFSFLIRLSP